MQNSDIVQIYDVRDN